MAPAKYHKPLNGVFYGAQTTLFSFQTISITHIQSAIATTSTRLIFIFHSHSAP